MKKFGMVGIYCIENLANGKKYIGQSTNIKSRFYDHLWSLRNNCHKNAYLQKSFNKWGEENFNFRIIDITENDIETMNLMEIYWIAYYNSFKDDNGYNLTRGGNNHCGFKHTEESKRKISESKSGSKHWIFGKTHSDKTKIKMSKSRMGNQNWNNYSEEKKNEIKKKISISLTGNKLPEEQKIQQSIRDSGRKNKKNSKSIYVGVFWESRSKKWGSQVYFLRTRYFLGYFLNEVDAALAYDQKTRELRGENAKTNFNFNNNMGQEITNGT